MRRPLAALAFATAALGATGCDKVKSLAGMGEADADASADAPASAGGRLLALLDKDFEGEITMAATTRGQGGPRTMVFGLKKPRLRVEAKDGLPGDNPMLAQGATILVDPPTKKAHVLMPSVKQAMVIDLEKAKAQGQAMQGKGGAPKPPPKVEKVGRKDVVAGYGCEVYAVTQEGTKTELCVAEGITWFDASDMIGLGAPDLAIAAVMGDANKFPLRMISYDAQGAEQIRLEATKVEKKTLENASFVVPADYRIMDMGAFAGGFGKDPSALPPGILPPKRKK
jgi:hypothetical protein